MLLAIFFIIGTAIFRGSLNYLIINAITSIGSIIGILMSNSILLIISCYGKVLSQIIKGIPINIFCEKSLCPLLLLFLLSLIPSINLCSVAFSSISNLFVPFLRLFGYYLLASHC